jgi:L-ascorbate metabolism protein UlaG (beta-lactamase superfamily)
MQINTPRTPVTRCTLPLLLLLVCLLGRVPSVFGASAPVVGPCEPTFVKHRHHGVRFMLASTQHSVQTMAAPVWLEWLGHSSFLLTSPDGLRLLTDPNTFYTLQATPDVVTVSNLHMTHSAVSQVPGAPQALWGITSERGWNSIVLTVKDVALFNVPSYTNRTEPENSPIQNSMFVFRTGGLCIVHLGNLRHLLTVQQLQRIGKPDVVLVPADGGWTLSFDDIVAVIKQLQPLVVIPMHINVTEQIEAFVQHMTGRYPVRRVDGHSLMLSRSTLPAATEIVVFKAP